MMKRSFLLSLALVLLLGHIATLEAFPAKEVYTKTSKSVVLIVAKGQRGGSLVGAGSIISDSGLVVTNAHVVIDKDTSRPFKNVRVYIKPRNVTGELSKDLVNKYKADVLAYDADLDLALLRIKKFDFDTRIIKLADPGEIMVGEEVVAIGHPEQGGLWTLTYGRISAQIANQSKVKGKDVFQTDTSVNRGNSGGPLLDGRGYMVGINTNIARQGAGNLAITGVNFAVKSSVVRKWMGNKGYQIAYGSEPLEKETYDEPAPAESKPAKEEPVIMAPAKKSVVKKPVASKPSIKKPVYQEPVDKLEKAEKESPKSDTVLTPKKPYTFDDLFEQVEKEMEDMMDEMRMKIR
jgi:serine protease Do